MRKQTILGILSVLFLSTASVLAQPEYNPTYDEISATATNLVQFDDLWQLDGVLYPSRDFSQAPLTGTAVRTYKDGRKTATEFKDGKGNGLTILWHANGQKASQGTLVNGILEGMLYQWDESGALVKETEYEDGKPLNKAGQQRPSSPETKP